VRLYGAYLFRNICDLAEFGFLGVPDLGDDRVEAFHLIVQPIQLLFQHVRLRIDFFDVNIVDLLDLLELMVLVLGLEVAEVPRSQTWRSLSRSASNSLCRSTESLFHVSGTFPHPRRFPPRPYSP
jgi:hypothetical protein